MSYTRWQTMKAWSNCRSMSGTLFLQLLYDGIPFKYFLSPLLHSKPESDESREQNHRFPESQSGRGWKEPLKVIWSNPPAMQWHLSVSAESLYQGLNSLNIWIGDFERILSVGTSPSYIPQWIPPQPHRLSPEFPCFPSARGVRDGTSARHKPISIWTWDPQNHTGSASLDVYWCLLQDKVFLSSEGLHSSPSSWLCWISFFFSPVTVYVLISTSVPLLSGCTGLMRQVLI